MFSHIPHFYLRIAEKGVKGMAFYLLNNHASSNQRMYFIGEELRLRVISSVNVRILFCLCSIPSSLKSCNLAFKPCLTQKRHTKKEKEKKMYSIWKHFRLLKLILKDTSSLKTSLIPLHPSCVECFVQYACYTLKDPQNK